MCAFVFLSPLYKALSGTFFEVLCLLRKTQELCPIAVAIKYLYPKTSMQGYPKYNILYIIFYILTSMGCIPFLHTADGTIIIYYTPYVLSELSSCHFSLAPSMSRCFLDI